MPASAATGEWPDNAVTRLANLKPSVLKGRLERINTFIGECTTAVPAWLLERSQILDAAAKAYEQIETEWDENICEIDRMLELAESELAATENRLNEAERQRVCFLIRPFAHGTDSIRSCLLNGLTVFELFNSGWRFTDRKILDRLLLSNDVSGLRKEVLVQLFFMLKETIDKGRSQAIASFHRTVVAVESNGTLAFGSWLYSWKQWKQAANVWCSPWTPEDEATFHSLWENAPGFAIAVNEEFDRCLPEMHARPIKKLLGRVLDERALSSANDEKCLIEEALRRQGAEAVQLRCKHGFTDGTIAAAAAYLGRTKKLADKLRVEMLEELEEQACCPYCNGPMGDIPRLDHIHPRSQGGLSKRDNLVFVCESCNLKKSDLTLLEFSERSALDLIRLVQTLRGMGKRA